MEEVENQGIKGKGSVSGKILVLTTDERPIVLVYVANAAHVYGECEPL